MDIINNNAESKNLFSEMSESETQKSNMQCEITVSSETTGDIINTTGVENQEAVLSFEMH